MTPILIINVGLVIFAVGKIDVIFLILWTMGGKFLNQVIIPSKVEEREVLERKGYTEVHRGGTEVHREEGLHGGKGLHGGARRF